MTTILEMQANKMPFLQKMCPKNAPIPTMSRISPATVLCRRLQKQPKTKTSYSKRKTAKATTNKNKIFKVKDCKSNHKQKQDIERESVSYTKMLKIEFFAVPILFCLY